MNYFGVREPSRSARVQQAQPRCRTSALLGLANIAGLLPQIRPRSSTRAVRQQVLDELRTALSDINGVVEIVLGGSIAKCTDLDDSDMDVVVMLDDIESLVDSQRFEDYLGAIESSLRLNLEVSLQRRSIYDDHIDMTMSSTNNILTNATYIHGSHRDVKFDVLVGTHLPLSGIASFDHQPELRPRFGGSFVRAHIERMSSSRVNKDGIRLAKWWVATATNLPRGRRPRGFLIELLAMHSCTNRGNMSPRDTFVSVLRLFEGWRGLAVTWNRSRNEWRQFHRRVRHPFVLDPCNLTNNVGRSIRQSDWQSWAGLARETLRVLNEPIAGSLLRNTNRDPSAEHVIDLLHEYVQLMQPSSRNPEYDFSRFELGDGNVEESDEDGSDSLGDQSDEDSSDSLGDRPTYVFS